MSDVRSRTWQATAKRTCECGRWQTPSRITVYTVPEGALFDVTLAVHVKCPECGEHFMMPFQREDSLSPRVGETVEDWTRRTRGE